MTVLDALEIFQTYNHVNTLNLDGVPVSHLLEAAGICEDTHIAARDLIEAEQSNDPAAAFLTGMLVAAWALRHQEQPSNCQPARLRRHHDRRTSHKPNRS